MSEQEEVRKLKEEIRSLTNKIIDHWKTIERLREEDRRMWREFTERIEKLEEVKSIRGKKRRYKRKTDNKNLSGNDGGREDGSGCDDQPLKVDRTAPTPATPGTGMVSVKTQKSSKEGAK